MDDDYHPNPDPWIKQKFIPKGTTSKKLKVKKSVRDIQPINSPSSSSLSSLSLQPSPTEESKKKEEEKNDEESPKLKQKRKKTAQKLENITKTNASTKSRVTKRPRKLTPFVK